MRYINKPYRRHGESDEAFAARMSKWQRRERMALVAKGGALAALAAFIVSFVWSCDPAWQSKPVPVGHNLCQYETGGSVYGVVVALGVETIRCIDTEGSGR